ncbi:enolase C-terminal domain-like protein [Bacteroidota bacterium]
MKNKKPQTRRQFLKQCSAGAALAGLSSHAFSSTLYSHNNADARQENDVKEYLYHGRIPGYKSFQIIEKGRKIKSIETFSKSSVSVVRITTDDGSEGWGQISTYDSDISAMVLHRKVASHFLGQDAADIDQLVDKALEGNHKYPWAYVCRAIGGIDTAVWDLYGKIKQKPVVELLGGKASPIAAYASSMRRDLPEFDANRLKKLKERDGYKAFKIRVGKRNGHNEDQTPGRTEKIIPLIRKTLGDEATLLADANSCYTPDRAIETGRMLEDNNYYFFEEPCPYWELEWTAEVTKALTKMNVSGGEQDNDLAQWRRMIKMDAVDIVQPDILYLGGITRTWRVAQMAHLASKKCIPHSTNIAMVTVFTLHMMGAIPNPGPFFELSIESSDIRNEALSLYSPTLRTIEGKVQIPENPGWGIEFNKDWLVKANYKKSEI